MVSIDNILVIVSALLTVFAIWKSFALSGGIEQLSIQLREDTSRLLELRYREGASRRMHSAQRISESAVDAGTIAIRGVHKSIADIHFGILDLIPATRKSARTVRETHDMISDIVYSSILGINKTAGQMTRDSMERRNNRGTTPQNKSEDGD